MTGDQIHQRHFGSGMQVGKQVGNIDNQGSGTGAAGIEEAVAELHDLLDRLRGLGIVDAEGEPLDLAGLEAEVTAQSGRLARLREAVRQGSGPTVQAALGSTAGGLVILVLRNLGL